MVQRHMPIGYKLVEGKAQTDDSEAEVVRRIFRSYAEGASLLDIAKSLAQAGVPNANGQPWWYHGGVGRILDNAQYRGDGFYPELIDGELFQRAQRRRIEQRELLGRYPQDQNRPKSNLFDALYCGECGNVYRSYAQRGGGPARRYLWKCKNSEYPGKSRCRNVTLMEEQIESAFLSAVNRILSQRGYLERTPRRKVVAVDPEFEKLDQKIKKLEAEGRYSSKELPALLFERAQAFYKTAQIDDAACSTEMMKQAFSDRQRITEFDAGLFRTVVKKVTVQADRHMLFEFINGVTLAVECHP